MHHFLSLKDDFQAKRLEWLLGTPMLMDGSMIKASPGEKPKLGAYAISSISEDVFYFPSTLETVDSSNESILSLIWRSKRRAETYTMFCIKELLTLGDDILKYIFKMPSPNFQFARYTDWIAQFTEDKSKSKSKDAEVYKDAILQVQSILAKYNEDVVKYEQELKEEHQMRYGLTEEEMNYFTDYDIQQISSEQENVTVIHTEKGDVKINNLPSDENFEFKAFPRPYVIGKVIEEREKLVQSTDNIRIEVTELECEWTWNRPLRKNFTTKKFMDYFVHRKGDISEWTKPMKQTVLQKNNVNEAFVDLSSSMFNKENDDENVPTNLKPICEDDEGDDDNNQDMAPVLEDNDREDKENDEMINQMINDRDDVDEQPEIPENFEKVAIEEDKENRDKSMHDINVSNLGEQKEEIIEEIDKSSVYQRDVIAIRISVYNFLKKKIKVQLQIESQDDSPNFFVPLCSIKAEIAANKAKTIAYFHKIHPGKPFGKYTFSYMTDAEEIAAESDNKKEGQAPQSGVSFKEDPTTWPSSDTNMENMQSEINCGACTMLNPISSFSCSVCGTKLPHRS